MSYDILYIDQQEGAIVMYNYENRFQDEMNSKFVRLPSGKVTAEFGSRMTFIPSAKISYIKEFKKRYPTEYKILFDEWFDAIRGF
jgi:hypothetical protein